MLEMIIHQRRKTLGPGIEVDRVLPYARRRMIGPFIAFDRLGPLDMPAGIGREVDVRPHPHIGLSTVTYMFSGEVVHRDSIGFEQAVGADEVNWMTSGSGITHSERFERAREHGDRLHFIQAWVALPDGLEEVAPSFSHHRGADLPVWSDGGVDGRLLAGEAFGLASAVPTMSPLFYAHLDMAAGSTAEIPTGHAERGVYVATGAIELGGQRHEAGRMLVVTSAASSIRALENSVVMMLGGAPLGERHMYWNFVSSSRERIAQAAADWREGRMKLPDADDAEFIPLPPGPAPGAPALS